MIEVLQDIIDAEGVPVEIIRNQQVIMNTVALIGKASRMFSSTLTMEYFRRGQFKIGVDVQNGDVAHFLPEDEYYIIIAVYQQIVESKPAGLMVSLMKCNASVDVIGQQTTALEGGDIVTQDTVKYSGLNSYIMLINSELRQMMPGLIDDAEYLVHLPGVQISVLDKLVSHVNGMGVPLKVLHVDYLTYPGMAVVQARTDTRE